MHYLDCEAVQMMCSTLISPTEPETTPDHEIPSDSTTTDLNTKEIGLQSHQSATVAMADLTITLFLSFLAMLVVHRQVKYYELLVVVTTLIVISEMCQGKQSDRN